MGAKLLEFKPENKSFPALEQQGCLSYNFNIVVLSIPEKFINGGSGACL